MKFPYHLSCGSLEAAARLSFGGRKSTAELIGPDITHSRDDQLLDPGLAIGCIMVKGSFLLLQQILDCVLG